MNDNSHQIMSPLRTGIRVVSGFVLAVVSTPLTLFFALAMVTGPHESMSSTRSFVSLFVAFVCMCIGWRLVQKNKKSKNGIDGIDCQNTHTSITDTSTATIEVNNLIDRKISKDSHVAEPKIDTPQVPSVNQTFSALQGFAIIFGVSFVGIMYMANFSEKTPELGSAVSTFAGDLIRSDRRLLKEQAILKTRMFEGSLCSEISDIKLTGRTSYGTSSQIAIYDSIKKADPPLPAMIYEATYTCRDDLLRSTTTETSMGFFVIDEKYNAIRCDYSSNSVLPHHNDTETENSLNKFVELCMFKPD